LRFFQSAACVGNTCCSYCDSRNAEVDRSWRFGATERQILFKIQLPLAKSTILAGINQVIIGLINGSYRFNGRS
jgi:glycine betaine/proline transport system permease protein